MEKKIEHKMYNIHKNSYIQTGSKRAEQIKTHKGVPNLTFVGCFGSACCVRIEDFIYNVIDSMLCHMKQLELQCL